MTRTRQKVKGRAEACGYLKLPHAVMNSANYVALSSHAVKLLTDLGVQFRGQNNGDLSAAWKIMQPRGWRSRDTLCKALKELLHFGMIELTRQGGLNRCSLYALTWHPIDDCKGKLDVSATITASGLWKQPQPPMPKSVAEKLKHPARPACQPDTATVLTRHAHRVNPA